MKNMKIVQYIIFIFICQALVSCTNPVQTDEIVPYEYVTESAEIALPVIAVETQTPEQEPVSEPVPKPVQIEPEIENVSTKSEYEYTIIGSWFREFDGHVEEYVFTETSLITFCDGVQNGYYHITHDADWTFLIGDILFDYELLHSEELNVLILNGYQYCKYNI